MTMGAREGLGEPRGDVPTLAVDTTPVVTDPVVTDTLYGRYALLVVLLTGQLMANMDSAIVNVAGPAIRADLGASGAQLELVVAVYILTYALLLPGGARLGDLRGYRSSYLGGAIVFTAASLLCGIAPGPIVLIVARAAQGIGAALMVPQVLTGIQLAFTGPARVRALGLYAVTLSAGAVLGQVIGGLIVHVDLFGLSWRPAFLINVPVGVALVVLGRKLMPVTVRARERRVDKLGMIILGAAMLLFVFPLVFGREQGWPLWTWLSLASSVPVFVAFVLVERGRQRAGRDLFVDLEVWRIRPVAWGLAAIALSHMTYTATLFTLPLHLQAGLGLSALWSGASVAVWAAAFGVAGVWWRRIPKRLWRYASPSGYLLLAGGYAGIALAVSAGLSGSVVLAVLLGVGGFGLGLGYLPLVASFTDSVAHHQVADISGSITTVLQLAGVVGVAAYGSLYFGLADAPGPRASTHAYVVVVLAFAATAVLATCAARLATRSHHAATAGGPEEGNRA